MRAQSVKFTSWQKAIDAYRNVPQTAVEAKPDSVWIDFIKSERKAFEEKCEFIVFEREALCMLDWQQAYKNTFLNGLLILQDPTCKVYGDAYRARYLTAPQGDLAR